MFKDLMTIWIGAFGFSVNRVSKGRDDRLNLHNDDLYYFKLNK